MGVGPSGLDGRRTWWRWPGLLLLLGRVTAHWDVGAAAAAKVGDDDDG